jgi:hypothetical protein
MRHKTNYFLYSVEYNAGLSRPRLTTHSTGARLSLSFIENLNLLALCARPVNSGVRCLHLSSAWNSLLRQPDAAHEVLEARVCAQGVIVRVYFEVLHLQVMRRVGSFE